MKYVYIMLLLNTDGVLTKDNIFKDGRSEIVKIGNSFDVKTRRTQINSSHSNLYVMENFEYPFSNYISIENQMHLEFEQYKTTIFDRNGCALTEYYEVTKDVYNKMHDSLKIKCLTYLPNIVDEFNKIEEDHNILIREHRLLNNKFEDDKEKFSLLEEKHFDIIQYKSIINKLLYCIFNDVDTNKEKTIIDALKLLEKT